MDKPEGGIESTVPIAKPSMARGVRRWISPRAGLKADRYMPVYIGLLVRRWISPSAGLKGLWQCSEQMHKWRQKMDKPEGGIERGC